MSRETPIIGVDVDGVIADLHTEWVVNRYNRDFNDNKTVEDITHWDLRLDIKPEAHDKIFEYLLDEDLYDNVKIIPGADVGVETLKSLGYRVVYITSCVPGMADQKLRWLSRNGFLPESTRPQVDFISAHDKSLITTDILIDDRYENVLNFKRVGVLFNQPYNRSYNWPHRVEGWNELPLYIFDIINKRRKAIFI